MLIGLAGYAGVGKDTAADVLVEEFDFRRVAFADPMREALELLDPFICNGEQEPIRLCSLVQSCGWNQAKQNAEVRRLLQAMGTEVGRNLLGQDLWVQLAARKFVDRTVVTDTRFPNEARLIKQSGGVLVRLNRPGFGPVNDHLSDRAFDTWKYDHLIENEGTVEELHQQMRDLVGRLKL
ncbi:MAG: hypothetical protein HY319_06200 [Armatimonadetes bacterium]|nr:hypothetical protein [Armatimonadota bacterium]